MERDQYSDQPATFQQTVFELIASLQEHVQPNYPNLEIIAKPIDDN